MKIKVITACIIDKKHRKVDEILDVKDSLARELISMDAVVPYRELPPSPVPAPTPAPKKK